MTKEMSYLKAVQGLRGWLGAVPPMETRIHTVPSAFRSALRGYHAEKEGKGKRHDIAEYDIPQKLFKILNWV